MSKVFNFIGSLIMWAAILICLALAAPRLAGIQSYVVISGSMEPSIPVGSLVYSREAEPETLVPGDVIVFYSSNSGAGGSGEVIPITHRVVENNTAAKEIITKGDANENTDLSPVTYPNVEGKVIFHIPGLGYPASMFSSTMGKVGALLTILAGYLLTEVGRALRKREKQDA